MKNGKTLDSFYVTLKGFPNALKNIVTQLTQLRKIIDANTDRLIKTNVEQTDKLFLSENGLSKSQQTDMNELAEKAKTLYVCIMFGSLFAVVPTTFNLTLSSSITSDIAVH